LSSLEIQAPVLYRFGDVLGRAALLPYVPVTLKSLRKHPFDFETQTLGEQIKKKRL